MSILLVGYVPVERTDLHFGRVSCWAPSGVYGPGKAEQVGFDRVASAVAGRRGLQVARGHPERALNLEQLVAGIGHELRFIWLLLSPIPQALSGLPCPAHAARAHGGDPQAGGPAQVVGGSGDRAADVLLRVAAQSLHRERAAAARA